jgi:putative PIN family toxin of toxin-antitoxin system
VRIVLDTNVVISALLWRGAPHQLLQAIRHHPAAQLCSSPILLEELTDVLMRPAASKRLTAIGKTSHAVLTDYLEAIELFDPVQLPPVSRDPDDDHVLACALAAHATCIVSGDRDLLTLDPFRDIRILPAREALALLTEPRG